MLSKEERKEKKVQKMIEKAQKPTLKEMFSSTASKAGGFSLATIAIVIAVVVVLNMAVSALPSKFITFDFSSNGTYSIGEQTEDIVKNLKNDVTLYLVCQNGSEDEKIEALLNSYKDVSKKIKVKTIDPVVNPTFTSKYTTENVEDNTVIVVCGDRSKILTLSDMYEYEYDYYSYSQNTTGFCAENAITNGIDFVTSENIPTISFISGHGEKELDSAFESALTKANFTVNSVNLLSKSGIPSDTDCLAVLAPASDYSKDEIKTLKSFVSNGGKLFIATNEIKTEKFPNLVKFLKDYGIKLVNGVILERDENMCYQSYFYLLPQKESHEITDTLSGYYVLMPISQGFNISETLPDGVSVSPLLSTSNKAYSAVNPENKKDIKVEEGDIESKTGFSLACAVTVSTDDEQTSGKIVYFANTTFINSQIDAAVGGANSTLFVKSFGWMSDKASSVSIPTKSLSMTNYTLTDSQVNVLQIAFLFVLPIVPLAIGIVIWIRRKKH